MDLRLAQRLAVTPDQYRRITYLTLFVLSLVVLSGAAVRLTGSGLGCANWPKCSGHVYPPLQLHALIEFGNRAVSGIIGVGTGVTAVLAFTRRPFRRDLAILAVLLPLGVVGQAVLGGYTVREKLAPGFVMSHFLLSMVILIAAVALAWRATHEPGSRPLATDRGLTWLVRALTPLAALTIFAGTASTAAGPHSGASVGQHVKRLDFKGADTLQWVVHQHATIAVLFGIAVIAAWLLRRRRGIAADPGDPLTVLAILLAAEGLVGSVQYELRLPAEMVWVHVGLATAIWLTTLWAWADAGSLAPRRVAVGAAQGAGARAGTLEAV
jgi:cytochrome c oxidase assembly protein subunit 15